MKSKIAEAATILAASTAIAVATIKITQVATTTITINGQRQAVPARTR